MDRDDREYRRHGGEESSDSADHLTGGYGGEPTREEEIDAEKTAGSSDLRDLGSSALDSGMTAGSTDTTVDPGIDDARP